MFICRYKNAETPYEIGYKPIYGLQIFNLSVVHIRKSFSYHSSVTVRYSIVRNIIKHIAINDEVINHYFHWQSLIMKNVKIKVSTLKIHSIFYCCGWVMVYIFWIWSKWLLQIRFNYIFFIKLSYSKLIVMPKGNWLVQSRFNYFRSNGMTSLSL